jgi:leukotriene-A4 hydrolase
MSAIRSPDGPVSLISGGQPTLTYKFEQKFPIPSYLSAIAIGKMSSQRIGPRSHVFAEPGLVEAAAYEFGETEEMLKTAEKFTGA